jgi:hypothetical protein
MRPQLVFIQENLFCAKYELSTKIEMNYKNNNRARSIINLLPGHEESVT